MIELATLPSTLPGLSLLTSILLVTSLAGLGSFVLGITSAAGARVPGAGRH